MFSFRLLRVVSFANLLTGNKLRCKIFRGLTGHAFEGYSLAIVQLVLNRHPRQALRGVLSKALLLCVAIMLLFCLEYKMSVTCHNVRIECFYSRGQPLYKLIGTKECVCIRKEFNSQRTGLGHQHGRLFIVLGHQYARRNVM